MSEAFFLGSKDRVVDRAMKMGTTDSLIFWCYITLFLLPVVPGHINWNTRGTLNRTFIIFGLLLLLYRSLKIPKTVDLPHQMI